MGMTLNWLTFFKRHKIQFVNLGQEEGEEGQISFRASSLLKVFCFTKYFKGKAPYYIQGVQFLRENDRKV